MKDFFDVLFIIDFCKECIVVVEVCKLNIFIIGIVDINCDLDEIDVVILVNDDVICVVKFLIFKMVDVILEVK